MLINAQEMRDKLAERHLPHVWYDFDAAEGGAIPDIQGFVFDDPEKTYRFEKHGIGDEYEQCQVRGEDGFVYHVSQLYSHHPENMTIEARRTGTATPWPRASARTHPHRSATT